jgi:hypothetical protein
MTDTMYIRFGALPTDGRSRNDETGEPEAGVSVYRAWWDNSDRDSITIEVTDDIAFAGSGMAGLFERPVYIVTGDPLDKRGGDGEPLMVNCAAELVGPVEVVNYAVEEAE